MKILAVMHMKNKPTGSRKQAVMDIASKVIKNVIHTNTYSVEAVNSEVRYNTGQRCSIKQTNKS